MTTIGGWDVVIVAGFWVVGLLLLIGVALLIALAIGALGRRGRDTGEPPRPTPTEILRERFARGEISAQEFEQAKKILGPDR